MHRLFSVSLISLLIVLISITTVIAQGGEKPNDRIGTVV